VGLCTENVSRNGLLVRLPEPLPVGTPTEVRLTAPDGSVITLEGEVARIVSPAYTGGDPGMAIKIVEADLKDLEERAIAMSQAREDSQTAPALRYGTNGPPSKIPHGRWLFGDETDEPLTVEEEDVEENCPTNPCPPLAQAPVASEDGPSPELSSRVIRRRSAGSSSSPGRYIKTFAGQSQDDDRPSSVDHLLCGTFGNEEPRQAPPQVREASSDTSFQEAPPHEGLRRGRRSQGHDFSPPRSTVPPPPPERPRMTPLPPRVPTLVGRAAPIIGLDFGTTYSKVGVVQSGEVVLIQEEGCQSANPAAIPSVVAYPEPGAPPIVGHRARELQPGNPGCIVSLIKRVLGQRYHAPMVDGILGTLACHTFAGPNDSILLEINGERLTVVEVTSHIIRHLKTLADTYTGSNVKQVVLTVPVDFDEAAQRELKLAARIAGLETVAMIPEPTAAVIGCGHDGSREVVVAVYDFGGGTFDVSIVEVHQRHFEICGTAGDRWLGGADIDSAIARYVADEFFRSSGLNLHKRVDQHLRLLQACEEAKRWLSTLPLADVIMPDAGYTAEGARTLFVPVTRACLEELSSDIIGSSIVVCSQALSQSRFSIDQIDEVLVTGGTTRIPAVRESLRQFFQREPRAGIHPENAVVMGAAIYAAMLSGQTLSKEAVERLMGKGVVGQSIGIALADGTTEHIIERSKRPPLAAFRLYGTARDNQDACGIKLYAGDNTHTADNQYIGGFVIDGLPPGPRGSVDIEVYFELSSTGTLCVTAQERSSGRRQRQTFELGLV
jgi:molecular chaperone DnaK